MSPDLDAIRCDLIARPVVARVHPFDSKWCSTGRPNNEAGEAGTARGVRGTDSGTEAKLAHGERHTVQLRLGGPGCALWLNRAPDIPLSLVESCDPPHPKAETPEAAVARLNALGGSTSAD